MFPIVSFGIWNEHTLIALLADVNIITIEAAIVVCQARTTTFVTIEIG